MKLTEKECTEALDEIKGLEIYDDDSDGNICYENHSKIKDLYSFYTLEQLIKEHFDNPIIEYYNAVFNDNDLSELFEKYAFENDDKLTEDAIKLKRELLSILDIYSKKMNIPLKFEDLKPNMWVWDIKTKRYLLVSCAKTWKNERLIITNLSGYEASVSFFEENRFYPSEVKENE